MTTDRKAGTGIGVQYAGILKWVALALRARQEEGSMATKGKRGSTTKAKRKPAATKHRSASKRDTVKAKNATFYAKRTERGRFKEMDEKGRCLNADRRTKATTKAKSGYGDRGDRAA